MPRTAQYNNQSIYDVEYEQGMESEQQLKCRPAGGYNVGVSKR